MTTLSRQLEKKRRSKVRAVSKRKAILNRLYAQAVAELLHYQKGLGVEIPLAWQCHHTRGRAGTLLIDQRYLMMVGPKEHRLIHDNPEEARARGFLCPRGLWNVPPDDAETDRLKVLIAEATKGLR